MSESLTNGFRGKNCFPMYNVIAIMSPMVIIRMSATLSEVRDERLNAERKTTLETGLDPQDRNHYDPSCKPI